MKRIKALIERYGYNVKQYEDGLGVISYNTEIGFINTIAKTITAEQIPAVFIEKIAQLLNGKIPKYYIKVETFCDTNSPVRQYVYVGFNPENEQIFLGNKSRLKYVQSQFDDYEIEQLKPFLNYFNNSLIIEEVENE